MKKTLTLFISALLIIISSQSHAQSEMSFDPDFNNNSLHYSTYNYINHNSSGRMRQLNDSVYVYFKSVNNGSNLITSEVFGKVVHTNGSVSEYLIFSQTDTTNDFNQYMITDLVSAGTDGSLFILKNNLYKVDVLAFSCNQSLLPSNPWSINTNFGTTGKITIQSTVDFSCEPLNARGAYTSNGLVLFAEKQSSSKSDLYRILVDGTNGGSFTQTLITNAAINQYHRIADVAVINDTTFAVADDYYLYALNTSTNWWQHNYQPRVWKVNLINNSPVFLSLGASVNFNDNFNYQTINRIHLDSQNRLWVLGLKQNEVVGGLKGYLLAISNYSNTPTLTWPISPNTVGGSTNYNFTDIKESPYTQGEYLLSGRTNMGMIAKVLPFQPDEAVVIPVYTSDNTMNINNINWFYFTPSSGGNANNTKVIFNSGTFYPALGRLVPSNPSASLESLSKEILTVYPNPGTEIIRITSTAATNATFVSASGAILSNLELNGDTSIDVSSYAPGIYFIRTAEGQTVKFIKE